ncbi:hypothetical protein H2248_010912 [Termitomyces sp. 'cryptogamus']|nr:hypothetical protein H2248_010912 [Termitomyces sp. 'cryptogamus']
MAFQLKERAGQEASHIFEGEKTGKSVTLTQPSLYRCHRHGVLSLQHMNAATTKTIYKLPSRHATLFTFTNITPWYINAQRLIVMPILRVVHASISSTALETMSLLS